MPSEKGAGRLVRFVQCLMLLAVPFVSGGCVAETEDDTGEEDEETAAQESAVSTACPRGGERYSFDGGKEIVCWRKANGPYGATDSYYDFLNNTGRAWRKKIALDNMPDTHCQRVGARKWYRFHVAGVRFAGTPQHVRGC